MSRVFLDAKIDTQYIALGRDHAMGWFFQLWTEDEEEEDVTIIDKDSLFTRGFGQEQMIDLIKAYAKDDEISRHCIEKIGMNRDPAIGLPQKKCTRTR